MYRRLFKLIFDIDYNRPGFFLFDMVEAIPASSKERAQLAQSAEVAVGLSTSIRFISFL
jgi:hypothetical protein